MVTVSDTRSFADDGAGDRVEAMLRDAGFSDIRRRLVRDEQAQIEAELRALVAAGCALILTAGGTGVGPRDVTPEATASVGDRVVPGVAEMLRSEGAKITPRAWLSRGAAVLAGSCLIVNLPGSTKGAGESCSLLLPQLEHLLSMLAGGGHA